MRTVSARRSPITELPQLVRRSAVRTGPAEPSTASWGRRPRWSGDERELAVRVPGHALAVRLGHLVERVGARDDDGEPALPDQPDQLQPRGVADLRAGVGTGPTAEDLDAGRGPAREVGQR